MCAWQRSALCRYVAGSVLGESGYLGLRTLQVKVLLQVGERMAGRWPEEVAGAVWKCFCASLETQNSPARN